MKRNGRVCLGVFAWLAWLQDEPGAAAVQHWVDEAEAAPAECVTSIINLGEAYYRRSGGVRDHPVAEIVPNTQPTSL